MLRRNSRKRAQRTQKKSLRKTSGDPTRKRVLAATNIVLLLLCLMYLLTYIDRVNVSTASNLFEKELGLNKTEVGFIFSVFAYPYLIFQIIGGYLGDRFGPRKVLTICSLIWAVATMLTGVVNGFVSMVIARLLLGFGEGATFPTATSAMANWTRPGRSRICAGPNPCFLPCRQLVDATDGSRSHGADGLAWLFCYSGDRQLYLGCLLVRPISR
jgi:sugar phosphate permease